MWLIVTTAVMTSFSSFMLLLAHVCYVMILDLVLGRLTWDALTGGPHPCAPESSITAQDTSMGLAHANCSSSADAGHKLHINRSLEAFSTPSRCDLVTRTEAPTLRPPQKITPDSRRVTHTKPESTLNSKSCHEDKFLFRYQICSLVFAFLMQMLDGFVAERSSVIWSNEHN